MLLLATRTPWISDSDIDTLQIWLLTHARFSGHISRDTSNPVGPIRNDIPDRNGTLHRSKPPVIGCCDLRPPRYVVSSSSTTTNQIQTEQHNDGFLHLSSPESTQNERLIHRKNHNPR